MKAIKYKQPTAKNCGYYALANVLNEPVFIGVEYTKGGEDGNRIIELNKALERESKDYFIDPIWVDRINYTLPDGFELYPSKENDIAPLLLIAKTKESSLWHCVGIHSYGTNKLHVLDSCKDEIVITDWIGVVKMYPIIESVHAFTYNDKNIDGYVTMTIMD